MTPEFFEAIKGLDLTPPDPTRRGIPSYGIRIGGIGSYKKIPEKIRPFAVVNMCDTFAPEFLGHPCYHWFPINELSPWGYMPFFASKRVLDALVNDYQKSVYLACAGGVHRSVMTGFCWLLSQGKTEEEAAELMESVDDPEHMVSKYRQDVMKGYIPERLPEMYSVMNECPGICFMSVLQNMSIREYTPWEKDFYDKRDNATG